MERVEVVESGHDEQTEDEEWVYTAEPVSALPGTVEAHKKGYEEAVAAVVGALQEAINACINRGEFDRADGLRRGLNFIEQRFKPSAPGGGNA